MQHKGPFFSGNASEDAPNEERKIICRPKKHESSDNTVVAVAFTSSRPLQATAGYGGREESGKCNYMSNSIPGVSKGYSNTTAMEIPGANSDNVPAARSFSGFGHKISTCKTSCPPGVSPGGLKNNLG